MSSNQEQVLRDARLRHRILAALSQASETLPPTVALNLRPLLQQGQTFVGSVSSAVLRDGLQQVSALIAEGITADGLLPMLDQAQRNMRPIERIVAAPFVRPIRAWLVDGDSVELAAWAAEIKTIIDEVLDEDALPPLVVAQ
jgi:hypothetical protein